MKDGILRFIKRDFTAWLIMIPSILLFIFYIFSPLINNISFSFYEVIGGEKEKFIGLQNYIDLFENEHFYKALGNTFEFAIWSVIIGFFIPIILAIILNEIIHLTGLFRTLIYVPNVIPGMAVAVMWLYLFSPESYGTLNSLFNIESLWLHDKDIVIPLIVLTMTWKGAGATTLIYLAVLQSIDTVQYEAARLEGANAFQRFRYVTWPHLLSQMKVLFILQIVSVFQLYYEPMVMTKGGGPDNESLSLVLLIYNYAFKDGNVGLASALSVIVSIILLLLSGLYFLLLQERQPRKKVKS